MKKIMITIIAVILTITCVAGLLFANSFYYTFFVPDDYGDEYSQIWVSDDETITFTTKTKKELSSPNDVHYGKIVKGKEVLNIRVNFNWECTIDDNNGFIIATGKYSYRKFAGKVTVKLEFIEDGYKHWFDDNTIVFTKLSDDSKSK